MKKLIAIALITCACISWGSTVQQQSITEIANSAALIFEGSVVGIRAVYENKRIYTLINFEISEVISGDYTQNRIQLRYLGGQIGDQALRVSEMELPLMGEQGIYFVESLEHPGVHPLMGWGQGHFKIVRNPRTADSEVRTSTNIKVSAVIAHQTELSSDTNIKINSQIAKGIVPAKEDSGFMTVAEFKDQIRALLE